MNRTRLHVTDLDGWLWYQKLDAMTADELRSRLRRTEPANEKMAMGTAWHAVLENPPDTIDAIEKDGYRFRIDCDHDIILPQVREVRANKDYEIDGAIVTLTGKVDGITWPKITDHKLTFRENLETYFDSYQWRAYLDIFESDVFEYIVYPAKEKDGEIIISDVSKLKMYRYPEMVDDLKQGIRELLGFIKEHVPGMIQASAI